MEKENLNLAYDFDLDPKDYKNSPDEWIRNLAINGRNAGMLPEEIEYLIKKRMKEKEEYEISRFKTDAERAYEAKRREGGSILNQAFWNE